MNHKLYSTFLAALLVMLGTQVRAQLSTTTIEGVDYYEIGNAADLVEFAVLVNEGAYSANALLTADIDMTGADISNFPIGGSDTGARFTGIFDGQGHKLSNFLLVNPEAGANFGMFNTGKGVVLKDFRLDSTCKIEGTELVGLVGRHDGGEATLINVGNGADVTGTNNNIGGLIGGTWAKSSAIETVTFRNCWTSGKILTTNPDLGNGKDCGAFSGWFNNAKVIFENCWTVADVVNPRSQEMYVFRNGSGASFSYTGCYSLGGAQPNFAKLSANTQNPLASGEICFQLNGDQSAISWYQTIGTDDCPLPYEAHGVVYMNGRQHCDNSAYEDATFFSNENKGIEKDNHDFVGGICSFCGIPDENYLTANEDGFYEIADEAQLRWFAAYVAATAHDAKAVLKSDIALTSAWTTPIGTSVAAYTGTFDGQGYSISGLEGTSTGRFGLFGYVKGATVQNFRISGSITATTSHGTGAVGWAESSTISGVHSTLDINVTNTDVVHHTGGVLGSAQGGNTIKGCSFAGTLTVAPGNTDCFGCVVGYMSSDAIEDCANYGSFTYEAPNCYAGGIVGYINNTSATVTNCLSVGNVAYVGEGDPTYGGAIVGRLRGHTPSRLTGNYWLEGSASAATGENALESAIEASSSLLASGEVTWKLNHESFIDVLWYQTLDEDLYPLLGGDAAIVYKTSEEYKCFSDKEPSTVGEFVNFIVESELAFIDETVAYRKLLDEYKAVITSWQDMETPTYAEFREAYIEAMELKEAVKASAAAYAAYVQNCEYALSYLKENNVEGEWCDFLQAYLEDDIEPCADYPNGSYSYIIDNCDLDDEAIAAETAFVSQMLENAIAGGITSGTEITRLLANSTFADGFEGWNAEYEGGSITTGGVAELMTIARGLNNSSFSASQTLSDVPNGVYLMTANGMFRAGADVTNQFYAGQLFLNGTANYFMSPGEDYIDAEDAEPGVNCLGEGKDAEYDVDGSVGYVPASLNGCSYAYSAGRYQNCVATEVTDGNLTVGVRNLGTGLANDWLPFGNIRIYYLGSADEANEKLGDVLTAFAERADVISNFLWDDYEDFAKYPNISEDLKARLAEAIGAVPAAETGEDKMKLIDSFSALFAEVHDCRMAYIAMREAANWMQDNIDALSSVGLISDDDYNLWSTNILDAMYKYSDGSVSAEEAWEIANQFRSANLVPIQVSEDGFYQLATVEDVKVFSLLVNCGNGSVKAVLAEDIDMSEVEDFEPIGSVDHPFTGEFDGQNHKVANFTTDQLSGDRVGFFGNIKNASVSNFSIDGDITYSAGGSGIGAIGWSEGSTISNVHSALNIAIVEAAAHHIGGVCGSMRVGSTATGCSFSGTISEMAGSHDCIGGIGGYSNEYCLYENCANYGTISFTASNAYAGGICGYVNNDSFYGVNNCLNVGTVAMSAGTPSYGGAIVGRLRSHANSVFENDYILEGSAARTCGENEIAAVSIVSAKQLASGEICYKLNGEQENTFWYQTLFADETHTIDPYPVLFPSHEEVLYSETLGYYNANDPDGIQSVATDLTRKGDGAVYDFSGRRVADTADGKLPHGLYIINGKKVLR